MTAARPLQVGVSELLAHPGSRKVFDAEVEVDDVLAGLGTSAAWLVPGSLVHIHLVLESLSNALTATGRVSAVWEGQCRRCLEPVTGEAEAELKEIFEARPTEGETYLLAGEAVDLEPLVRDAVLLALPLAPLCGPDCKGPAPEHYPAQAAGEETAPARDPRWAALDELTFDE